MRPSRLPLFHLLKKTGYLAIFLLTGGALFGLSYYAMAYLPGERNLACVMGAGLTGWNVLFSFLMSAAAALIVLGLIDLIRQKAALSSVKLGSTSMVGLAAGLLTTFCTLCTLPVISLFGLGISLSLFTDYEIYFKIGSLLVLSVSLYLVNQQLRGRCRVCVG